MQLRKPRLLLCALFCLLPAPVFADLQLGNAMVHFASVSEGRQTLTAKDDFIQRLSPFDRAARMKVDHAVSEDELLTFIGDNVVSWTKEQIEEVERAIDEIRPLLRDLPLTLPATIQMIQTTGNEEGNAAYTRNSAIIFPRGNLTNGREELERLICHELFHILSRHNPELRERLYAIIGFTKCNEMELPPDLKPRKITNPDAPRNDHFIRLKIGGRECLAVPILLSRVESYDTKQGGEFFNYLKFQFLVVEKGPGSQNFQPVYEGSSPKLAGPEQVTGFFEQIGRNTTYVIHPEEILADNFALLVLKKNEAASPEILEKMRETLRQKPKG
jgi:hypothetical protein